MKVTCTGRRVTLKPSFIENAEKRLAKLDKFFPDEAQAQVTVTVEKSGQTVEIMLRSKDLAMRAEKTDERMEDALADAVDLLTRRVVKYRKRLGTKLTAAAAEIPATEPEESMDIVREKHFALKPCSTEEAILQMDLLGHSFFLYHSTENDKIQVVYLYRDGVDLSIISRFLGHAQLETTRIYATPSVEMMRRAIAKMPMAALDEDPIWDADADAMMAKLCGLR